ncbi:MAG: hypothetical protein AAB316_01070 [Bacteroidota bacterium]
MKDSIKIKVSKQMDGYNFSLDPLEEDALLEAFPSAQPLGKIFVAFDKNGNVELLYDRVSKYIFPALVGIENPKDLKKIKRLEFMNPYPETIIRTVNLNAA